MAGSPNFPKLRVGGDASRTQDNISQQVQPIASAVAATPLLSGTLPSWIRLSLLADFVNVGGVGVPLAGYHKDAMGYVHFQGLISSAAGQAAGTAVFTLPSGVRPVSFQWLTVKGNAATYQNLAVNPNGSVTIDVAVAAGAGLALGGSFLADG